MGVETGVVALTRRGPIADEIEAAGVPVHLVPGEPGPRDPAAFVRLVRLLQREQPDVVHTFLIVAGIYGRLAAFAAGVPLVLAAEQNVYARKPKRHALMERALAARTYRVVACCEVVGRYYQQQVGVPRSKVEVIYNAVRFGRRPQPTDRETARFALRLPPDALVLGHPRAADRAEGPARPPPGRRRARPRLPRPRPVPGWRRAAPRRSRSRGRPARPRRPGPLPRPAPRPRDALRRDGRLRAAVSLGGPVAGAGRGDGRRPGRRRDRRRRQPRGRPRRPDRPARPAGRCRRARGRPRYALPRPRPPRRRSAMPPPPTPAPASRSSSTSPSLPRSTGRASPSASGSPPCSGARR